MSDATNTSLGVHVRRRSRKLRRTPETRRFVRETDLSPAHFVYPLFVVEGTNIARDIEQLPGVRHASVDRLMTDIDLLTTYGIPAVLVFGVPDSKDEVGTRAWDPEGPAARAIAFIKKRAPGVVVIADVCLCAYTTHGHCGVAHEASQSVDNDSTLPLLARAAVAYARAGADIVAPSAMMDGQVAAIRSALDEAGFHDVAILSYAAKFASALYGPFRDAAVSAPAFGDRRSYQMDPANAREAITEIQNDIDEGADLVMVKPAGPYLDVIRDARSRVLTPIVAYQVSGEYAMIKAAAKLGVVDERAAMIESLLGIRRAGADLIVSYYALDAARWLMRNSA